MRLLVLLFLAYASASAETLAPASSSGLHPCNSVIPVSLNGTEIELTAFESNVNPCRIFINLIDHSIVNTLDYGFRVDFDQFQLRQSQCANENKCCNSIQIGHDDTVVAKVCDEKSASSLVLTSPTFWIQREVNSFKDFEATSLNIRPIRLRYTDDSDTITFMNYSNNLNLTFSIELSVDKQIMVKVDTIDLESNNQQDECVDSLTFSSVGANFADRKMCQEKSISFSIDSNQAVLSFVSDESVTRSGFRISYSAVKYMFVEPSGTIESPVEHLSMTYIIRAPADHIVELKFVDFEFDKCLANDDTVAMMTDLVQLDNLNSTCFMYNDYIQLANKQGSTSDALYQAVRQITGDTDKWIFCACNKPVQVYSSLTNEIHLNYQVTSYMEDHQTHKNRFRISYKFVPAVHDQMASIRVRQDELSGSFVDGYLTKVKVPRNHHLRISGRSATCKFPPVSYLYQEFNSPSQQSPLGQKMQLNLVEFKKSSCFYSFELNEPARADEASEWLVNWYLSFNGSSVKYDFEVAWSFVKNKFVDVKKPGVISLPSAQQSCFQFEDDSQINQLEFTFLSTHLEQVYNVYSRINSMLSGGSMDDFLEQKYITYYAKNFDKFELLNSQVFTEQNPFKLSDIGVNRLRVKRDNKYSFDIVYALDSTPGDCDFDHSLCGYVIGLDPHQATIRELYSLRNNTKNTLVKHLPKYPYLSMNDVEAETKANDLFLGIRKEEHEVSSLYSPLVRVQGESNGISASFNQRIYSLSFKYMLTATQNTWQVDILSNRSDVANFTRANIKFDTIGLFGMNTETPKIKMADQCQDCINRDQYIKWKEGMAIKSEHQDELEDFENQRNWFQVTNLTFFSCYDFRVVFSSHGGDKVTETNTETLMGLDDIELNVDQNLLAQCELNTCLNNGQCFKYGEETRCCCQPGFTGDRCETRMGICELLNSENEFKNICKNNGTCVNNPEEFDYACLCPDGYTGKNCEIEVNECDSNPCQNGAQCLDLVNGYGCICKSGFSGHDCQFENQDCRSVCNHDNTVECFTNRQGHVMCVCKANFQGSDCSQPVLSDQCSPEKNQCSSESECALDPNSPDGYRCICKQDRTGRFCETKINFCDDYPNLCMNGSVCTFASEDGRAFACSCQTGFTGPHCNETVDHCASSPCANGICVSSLTGFNCDCYKGFAGKNCNMTYSDPCYRNKCVMGNCVRNGPSNYTCSCHPHVRGEYCEINECLQQKCDPAGTEASLSTNTGCVCKCKPEYSGAKCETKLSRCQMRYLFNKEEECMNGGSCVYDNTTDSISCQCRPGFSGSRCQLNQDFCQSNPCVHGTCRNKVDGYECRCSRGWTGLNCTKMSSICVKSENCVEENTLDVVQSRKSCFCLCKPGFTGDRCQTNIDDCALNNVECLNNGTCVDLINSYECKCPIGFSGFNCRDPVFDCSVNPCKHGYCDMEGSQIICVCDRGYTGQYCETLIDKCDPNPCQNAGKCHNLIDGYVCECPDEYGHSVNCTDRLIDPCRTSPCLNNGTCESPGVLSTELSVRVYTEFECKCKPNYAGKYCEIFQDACASNPCGNRGFCQLDRTGTDYKCMCLPTYTGKHCESYYDRCRMSDEKCQNGGTCFNTHSGIQCACPFPYSGQYCERSFTACDLMKCLNGGRCALNQTVPYCKCSSNRFIGTRCEIDLNEVKFSKEALKPEAFHVGQVTCDMLGNSVTLADYLLVGLIIFFVLVVLVVCIYIFVYIRKKRVKREYTQMRNEKEQPVLEGGITNEMPEE